jgi:hypothetical protein
MATSAMTGALGWAPQAALGTAGLAADTYWHKALDVGMAQTSLDNTFPPEVGGTLLPSGAFRGGYWVGGDVSMIPRLTKAIGWLLYAFAGSVSSTGSGPYMHIFPAGADDTIPTKYMTFKKIVPVTSGNTMGEIYQDCKVMGLQIDATPGNMITMRVNALGLSSTFVDNPTGAGWAPSTDNGGYEAYTAAPIACGGTFELPDGTPITSMTNVSLNLALGGMNPQQEMVLGSYSPDDITILSRNITVTGTFRWKNSTLYRNLTYNGADAWSPIVWTGGQPFEVNFETPTAVFNSATGVLGLWAQTMTWSAQPLRLRGGDIVVMQMTGTVLDTGDASQDWRLYLRNSTSSYAWPE